MSETGGAQSEADTNESAVEYFVSEETEQMEVFFKYSLFYLFIE